MPSPRRHPAIVSSLTPFGEYGLCAIIECPEIDRVLPIWMASFDAFALEMIVRKSAVSRKRHVVDSLFEALEHYGGIKDIDIAVFVEGVYIAVINCHDGFQLELRPSDALVLHLTHEFPLFVTEDVVKHGSVRVGDPTWRKLLALKGDQSAPDQAESASGDAQADQDFLQLMADMGVTEAELDLGEDDGDEVSPS